MNEPLQYLIRTSESIRHLRRTDPSNWQLTALIATYDAVKAALLERATALSVEEEV